MAEAGRIVVLWLPGQRRGRARDPIDSRQPIIESRGRRDSSCPRHECRTIATAEAKEKDKPSGAKSKEILAAVVGPSRGALGAR